MDGYLFFENFPPWTPLFGPGRLLIFWQNFTTLELIEKHQKLKINTQCFPKNPPWTIIPSWTFISLLGMFHLGRLIDPGRLFGRTQYGQPRKMGF